MLHRDMELIGCPRRNVEAGGNFSFAVSDRNEQPNFGQHFPYQL
jgi:hypothetical protein